MSEIERHELSELFKEPGVVYCSQMAPSSEWPRGQITYCCLALGHDGPHRFVPKWIKVTKKPAARK